MTAWIGNIKNQLFKKIIIFYSFIAIIFLTCLSCLSIYIINDNKTKEVKNANSRLVDEIYYTINSKHNTSLNILQSLLDNKSYKDSILTFMDMGLAEFYKFSLDSYFEQNISYYSKLNTYLANSLRQDPDINSIILYSSSSEFVYSYDNKRNVKYYDSTTATYLDYKSKLDYTLSRKPRFTTNLSIDDNTSNSFSLVLTIQNPISLKSVGKLIINYSNRSIYNNYFNNSSTINPGHIVVLTTDNQVVFDSTNGYKQYVDPYLIGSTTYDYSELNDSIYTKSLKNSDINMIILGIIPKKIIHGYVQPTILLILVVTVICIVAIIGFSILFTASYSKRLYKITSAIKKVRKGDLSIRIETNDKRDELTEIANNFNRMCDDLDDYIEKVYVYQVKQKSAELKSLQAQINPHFLYNTLESIRMRAAVRGARDVSDMIYILATFFRNSLKSETITTIEKEIEHCKLYLKLFQIRYNDKLSVVFNIDESMLSYSIVNLSLQPIVENYIVHGIDLDASTNTISITGRLENEDIFIEIEDNGCGIPKDILTNINLALDNKIDPSSIGIFNVHERLKIVYGDSYGLAINSEENIGTKITIHIPAKKKGEL